MIVAGGWYQSSSGGSSGTDADIVTGAGSTTAVPEPLVWYESHSEVQTTLSLDTPPAVESPSWSA